MKDEIKEILIRVKEQQAIDVFKEFIETKGNLVTDYSLETYMQVILDYITNLQEQLHQASLDIQELTERDIWCPSNCDKLTNLQAKIDKAIKYIEQCS